VNEVAGRGPASRLNAEPGAAFAPAAAHHGAPAFGFHARAKPMRTFALHFAGLVCTFHLNVLGYPGKGGQPYCSGREFVNTRFGFFPGNFRQIMAVFVNVDNWKLCR